MCHIYYICVTHLTLNIFNMLWPYFNFHIEGKQTSHNLSITQKKTKRKSFCEICPNIWVEHHINTSQTFLQTTIAKATLKPLKSPKTSWSHSIHCDLKTNWADATIKRAVWPKSSSPTSLHTGPHPCLGCPPAAGTLLYGNEPCCSNLYEGLLSRVESGEWIYMDRFPIVPLCPGPLLWNIITAWS